MFYKFHDYLILVNEYKIKGINQIQVNVKTNLTFANGLRSVLRQDPDYIFVGEIRDNETAEIAVQASLTGHLVFSTLHTNTAVGAVTRLRDMGVERFLLSSSLIGVIAQRLVRLLCHECRTTYTPDAHECTLLGVDSDYPPTLYRPQGCSVCNGLGYTGRNGIYEFIEIDETTRNLIHEGASEQEVERHVHQYSPTIRQDGMRLVLEGRTSLEEVLRVTRADSKQAIAESV